MPSRRTFLMMVSPIIAAPALAIPIRTEAIGDECEYYASCLAEAMRKRHGGTPIVTVNHSLAIAQVIIA